MAAVLLPRPAPCWQGAPRASHLPGSTRVSSNTTSASFGSMAFGRGFPVHILPFH
jgi:hypothetical protein